MQLSEHFTLAEFIRSDTAARRGIDNTPSPVVLTNLKLTAIGMEKVRALLGTPIIISSGYRSPELNAAIGGSTQSHHMQGLACDFTCPDYGSPIEICRRIAAADAVVFDQLIYEHSWVHVSFAPALRGQVLTLRPAGGGYAQGIG
jgi:zinc D-Ala-D-Ala carboxypeptidase